MTPDLISNSPFDEKANARQTRRRINLVLIVTGRTTIPTFTFVVVCRLQFDVGLA